MNLQLIAAGNVFRRHQSYSGRACNRLYADYFTRGDLESIMRQEIFSYASALQVGPWHPWWEADGLIDQLEEAKLSLGQPVAEKRQPLARPDLARILTRLENVYRVRGVEWKEFGISTPPKISEARNWILARSEIENMFKLIEMVNQ